MDSYSTFLKPYRKVHLVISMKYFKRQKFVVSIKNQCYNLNSYRYSGLITSEFRGMSKEFDFFEFSI